jgi:hypothetical protein
LPSDGWVPEAGFTREPGGTLTEDRAGSSPAEAVRDERNVRSLAACLAGLADPRETRKCDHWLIDVLTIAVCTVIACADRWEGVELYGWSKQA